MARSDNVAALIEADKAVHADMEARYKDGPYQDGMYGTGMLLELGRRGFVVVPAQERAAATRSRSAESSAVSAPYDPLGEGSLTLDSRSE